MSTRANLLGVGIGVAVALVLVLVIGVTLRVLGGESEPAGPADTPGPPVSTTLGPSGEVVAVRQMLGQPGQEADCGPAAVVALLVARGITPDAWDAADPRQAIVEMQGPVRMNLADPEDPTSGTTPADLERGLLSYGVDTERVSSSDAALQTVRHGGMGIIRGRTLVFGWPQDLTESVSHVVFLAGYDSAADEYLVVDPISAASADEVHRVSADEIEEFMDADSEPLGVMVAS